MYECKDERVRNFDSEMLRRGLDKKHPFLFYNVCLMLVFIMMLFVVPFCSVCVVSV